MRQEGEQERATQKGDGCTRHGAAIHGEQLLPCRHNAIKPPLVPPLDLMGFFTVSVRPVSKS